MQVALAASRRAARSGASVHDAAARCRGGRHQQRPAPFRCWTNSVYAARLPAARSARKRRRLGIGTTTIPPASTSTRVDGPGIANTCTPRPPSGDPIGWRARRAVPHAAFRRATCGVKSARRYSCRSPSLCLARTSHKWGLLIMAASRLRRPRANWRRRQAPPVHKFVEHRDGSGSSLQPDWPFQHPTGHDMPSQQSAAFDAAPGAAQAGQNLLRWLQACLVLYLAFSWQITDTVARLKPHT